MKQSQRRYRGARAEKAPVPPTAQDRMRQMAISYAAMAQFQGNEAANTPKGSFGPPKIMPGVVPAERKAEMLAFDEGMRDVYAYASEAWSGMGFLGYPYLSELTQRPEYRKMSEVIAKEMTRKWVKLQTTGDGDKSEKIAQLEKAMKRYNLRALFRKAAEQDGFFGRSQIYIDVKTPAGVAASTQPDELKTPLIRASAKIKRGSLTGFKVIEPIWTTPYLYNSDDPMRPDFFRPTSWFVMGKQVHSTRLLNFVSREVPDMLKPSYNFGGLSLSQIAIPYVDNWLRTRQSVSDLISAFSIPVLKTNLMSVLNGGTGTDVFQRLQLFNQMRNNRGAWAINSGDPNAGGEEFQLFNVPLSGLDALQAQSQEQMASVSNIPLVKLLGITPAGLNANSDGEIRVFYDFIGSMQEDLFSQNLQRALEVIQLSEFGEIDPDITFMFVPLYQLDDLQKAQIRKSDADTDAVLTGAGIISPTEARERLAADPENGYHSLEIEPDDDPEFEDEDETDDGNDLNE